MGKYYIVTFGCQMNKSDSERIARVLEEMNCEPATKIELADLVVVNMCSVRQSAVDRVWGLEPKLKKLKKRNPEFKTVLTGCILKKDRKKLKRKFDYLMDIKDLPNLPKILNLAPRREEKDYLKIRPKHSSNFSAHVPITVGCNNFCSYCVVPYTRGREVSRPAGEILCEVKNLVKRGYKEIWLLGENVNSYINTQRTMNNEQKINFPKLLRMVNAIPGNFWVRFTSSHPKDLSDELIEVMANCKKVTKYLNLPVQSGDNEILKKMRRLYTVRHYKNLVKKIRNKIPQITLSTDVIVGFPGETRKHFGNTCKLFEEIKFDMAYIAKYSPRPGTAASKMQDNVPDNEKNRREKILTEILKRSAQENNKKFIGKTIVVLPQKQKKGFLIGKSKKYKTVKFKGDEKLIGNFIKVKITNAFPWGLKGKLCKN